MFDKLVKDIVDNCDGALAACVMGFDGVPVSMISKDSSVDAQAISAEFAFVLTQIRKAAEVLEAGALEEVTIRSEKVTFIVRMLTDEFFVAMVIRPEGNVGKGRFLMRKTVPELRANL